MSKETFLENHPEYTGVDLDDRWVKGTKHHPKSVELMLELADIDWHLFNDFFCWKTGGDGDNGETLMYQLDIYFDMEDLEP